MENPNGVVVAVVAAVVLLNKPSPGVAVAVVAPPSAGVVPPSPNPRNKMQNYIFEHKKDYVWGKREVKTWSSC